MPFTTHEQKVLEWLSAKLEGAKLQDCQLHPYVHALVKVCLFLQLTISYNYEFTLHLVLLDVASMYLHCKVTVTTC